MPWYRPDAVEPRHRRRASSAGAAAGPSGPTISSTACRPPSRWAAARRPAWRSTTTSCIPVRYHNALFVCDWSRGRILAVRTKPHGATLQGHGRSVPRRPAAERHRHRRRPRRLAVLLHRRPRHRRRHLPRRVGRQGAARASLNRGKGMARRRSSSRSSTAPGLGSGSRWSSSNWATNGARSLTAVAADRQAAAEAPRCAPWS